MHKKYKDKAKFLIIYIREAHPGETLADVDGKTKTWGKTTSIDQRATAAKACLNSLNLTMQFVIDDMEATTEKAYCGHPNRIFVIDIDGKVAMKGPPGPGGVTVPQAEAVLKEILANGGKSSASVAAGTAGGEDALPVPAIKDLPDGSYTGKGEGLGGELTVSVVIKSGRIVQVKLVEHGESKNRREVRKALKRIPKSVVKKQKTSVDAVTGATYSSKAIIAAVENALRSAKK